MVINFRIPPGNAKPKKDPKKGDAKDESETQTISELQPVVEAFFKSFIPHPTDSKQKQSFESKWTPERYFYILL